MSVIVSRALPDVRDGLKPVHRRVMYAMHEAGLQPNRPTRKSARVVGDVMGNYHPHGDQAIYDALVRLAQPFSLRYPLVDGQGYFGSVDGDPAGAMRYTECRLSRIATELLRDIDADTVDFMPNYDESRREPMVLPARFPNLLVNGSAGIAVGMATNMPPHNLGEIVNGIVAMIDEPAINVEKLMKHVKGPDFPTGGAIVGYSGIRDAYRTGRGRIIVRGRAHIEQLRGGKSAIIVTELPYGVRKAGEGGVIEKIADLVKAGTLTEVPMSDEALQDHSDKEGMRIYVELKRDAIPQVALNKLFKLTPLQTTFGYNAVALVDGVPKTLSLLELVRYYLDYQREIVTRRSKYELRQAERARARPRGLPQGARQPRRGHRADPRRRRHRRRAHRPDGAVRALGDPGPGDPRPPPRAPDRARAQGDRGGVQGPPGADHGAARDPRRPGQGRRVIKDELAELVTGYAKDDERRTEIVAGEDELELEDLIAEEDMVIAITRSGYVKRLPVSAYREQRRGGIGVMGMDLKDEDYIEHLFVASTHDYLLFFTTVGKVYRLKVHELPLGTRQSKGRAIVNLLPFAQDEQVKAVIATREFKEAEYLVLATRNGMVKKTRFEEYNTPLKADGIIAIKLRDGDALVDVLHSSGTDDIMLVSRKGQAIRFAEQNARPMGRATSGVKGMSLRKGDEVIAAAIARDDLDMLVVTDQGYGKRTRMADYPVKGRGGLGVKTVQLTEARGQLAGAVAVREGEQLIVISTGGTVIKMSVSEIKRLGRATQGVIVVRLRKAELVSSIALVAESEDDEAEEAPAAEPAAEEPAETP